MLVNQDPARISRTRELFFLSFLFVYLMLCLWWRWRFFDVGVKPSTVLNLFTLNAAFVCQFIWFFRVSILFHLGSFRCHFRSHQSSAIPLGNPHLFFFNYIYIFKKKTIWLFFCSSWRNDLIHPTRAVTSSAGRQRLDGNSEKKEKELTYITVGSKRPLRLVRRHTYKKRR